MSDQQQHRARTFIILMGIVSLFGDMTYEGARSLTGPFLDLLGASSFIIGFAAGLGEFLGYGLRLLTGWLGDKTRAYWVFVIAGYSVNLVAVPGLALSGRWESAVALVLLERIGKAIRSPSRSTLVSYAARTAGAGKSFGIDEALDQIGAVSGPVLVTAVMWLKASDPVLERYRFALTLLALPVLATLGFVMLARRKFPRPDQFDVQPQARPNFVGNFRVLCVGAMLLAFGFADWALIAFHLGHQASWAGASLPLLYAGVMAVDAIAALGFGVWFDRSGTSVLAFFSLASAFFAPLVFLQSSMWAMALGAAVWGASLGAQETLFKAVIAQLTPARGRGRAYGVFFALFGAAWWAGSSAAGWLYERSLVGAVLLSVVPQLAAALVFWWLARSKPV